MTTFEQLRAALERDPIRVPDSVPVPRVGQVWRAVWEGTVANVYVDAVSDDTVTVCPMTGHPALVSAVRVFLAATESPLGYPSAIWSGPRIEAPAFVLAGCYGEVPQEVPEEPYAPLAPLSERARSADSGWHLEQHVRQTFALLAEATWFPTTQPVGPVRALMNSAKVKARSLAESAGLTADILELVLDGSWWIGEQSKEMLASSLNVSAQDLPHKDPFAKASELARAINSPSRKQAFLLTAQRDRVREAAARLIAAQQLMPARTRLAAQSVDERAKWDQLLDLYFENG